MQHRVMFVPEAGIDLEACDLKAHDVVGREAAYEKAMELIERDEADGTAAGYEEFYAEARSKLQEFVCGRDFEGCPLAMTICYGTILIS